MTSTELPQTTTAGPTRATWRPLARHYAEMVVAMFIGMLVLGALRELLGLTVAFEASPGASYLLMATDMALGMAAWMLVRGHTWASTLEMCAAMYVPVVLLPAVWVGALGATAFMVLAHVVMLAAMLGVLVRQDRRTEEPCPS